MPELLAIERPRQTRIFPLQRGSFSPTPKVALKPTALHEAGKNATAQASVVQRKNFPKKSL
jgi:hypothetical protein